VTVADPTGKSAGSITIDTKNRFLYLSLGDGRALRYTVGVGRAGFEWSGQARVGRMAEWPAWTPPPAMLKRRPDLPSRMEGGIENPLGARALYLYQNGRDTAIRIHGTTEPDSIGRSVSNGCLRMVNEHVIDLYNRVAMGAPVAVY
jgi:lipoprotein-anchoring transpeptidase ErfK/SrfK